jgi:hypothetical protein
VEVPTAPAELVTGKPSETCADLHGRLIVVGRCGP